MNLAENVLADLERLPVILPRGGEIAQLLGYQPKIRIVPARILAELAFQLEIGLQRARIVLPGMRVIAQLHRYAPKTEVVARHILMHAPA